MKLPAKILARVGRKPGQRIGAKPGGGSCVDRAWAEEMMASGHMLFLRTINPTNAREHWGRRQRRAKTERNCGYVLGLGLKRTCNLPITIRLTRYGPNPIDSDSLPVCTKSVRDGLADAWEVTDGHDSPLKFEYAQVQTEKLSRFGVRIEIVRPF